MTREMYVSSTPHETKVAIVEDDQLSELFFERENEYTLAGSIYKGRVTRVLPGMQSAFVDIGLERDAFLYVSDFLELPEDEDGEFEEIAVTRPETFITNRPVAEPRFEFKPESSPAEAESARAPLGEEVEAGGDSAQAPFAADAAAEGEEQRDREPRGRGRRRRGRRGRGFPESKFARATAHEEQSEPENEGSPSGSARIMLPGESISKYQSRGEHPGESPEAVLEPAAPEPEEEASLSPAEPESPEREPYSAPPASVGREPRPEPRQEESHSPTSSILLPGESIAKYQSHSDQPATAAEEKSAPVAPEAAPVEVSAAAPVSEAEPEAQTPARHTPPVSHISGRFTVLPGESIAKYQSRSEKTGVEQEKPQESPEDRAEVKAAEVKTAEVKTEEASLQEPAVPAAATFVIESEPWAEPEAQTLRAGESEEEEGDSKTAVGAVETPEATVEPWLNLVESPQGISGETSATAAPAGESEEEKTTGSEEVLSAEERAMAETARADAAGQFSSRIPSEISFGEPSSPQAEERAISSHDERFFGATGTGTLEHEEIEGDEADFRPPDEEEGDAEFVELEEESFDRNGRFAAEAEDQEPVDTLQDEELSEAVDAVRESEAEHAERAEAGEENGDADGDLSFEEEELVEEALAGEDEALMLPEEQQEEAMAGTRAELRGPSNTSHYQRADRATDQRRGRRPTRRLVRGHEQPRHRVQIADLLKEGQEILVQIAKEPIGKKGARITSHIALPGRFLVYMPTVNHVGVSRKITSDEERQRLKRIMISEREGGHGGFIVRTAAAGVGEDELRADIRFLKNLWAQIKQRSDSGKAPALIYHDLNLVERILRDLVTTEFSQVWVDTEQEYERILNFAHRFQPSLVRRVRLYTKETPLFEQFGIQEELDKSLKSKVWLKSGGYIVINQTEALVAIDVNTGKYVGKTARLEDTIVKTNVDAIREIVRQIRLRDLGGIIVIDFIDMDERKNRQKVMQALEEALKNDRSPSKVLAFNDFGLVAITRKRVKKSLERALDLPARTAPATAS